MTEMAEMVKEVDFLIEMAKAVIEAGNNPQKSHVARQRVIEHIKVDFIAMEEMLISIVRLVNNGQATKDDYRAAFYRMWSDKAPTRFVDSINDGTKKGLEGVTRFRELIMEMGDKVYALIDGDSKICVSVEIPPIPCNKCYFASICKLAVKNKSITK